MSQTKRCGCPDDGGGSWELCDVRGIYVALVCEVCEPAIKRGFRPEIFTDAAYQCDEPIEPEDS